MPAFDLDACVARSGALDLSAVAWEDISRHPDWPETMGTLRILAERASAELNVMPCDLFAGEECHVALRRVDETIRRFPGFASAQHLEAWMDRNIGRSSSVSGGHNGHGHH